MSSSLAALNTTHGLINSTNFPTSLLITPSTTTPTDIWRKSGPPEIDTFNAPVLYRIIPLSKFKSVRVKVSAKWSKMYDQGGLIFVLPEKIDEKRRWVKTGIEFYGERELVSTVGCDRWADWSLSEIGIKDVEGAGKGVELLIEIRERDNTLWVFVIDGEKKVPIREVTWVTTASGEEKEVWVGIYAATPTVEEGKREELEVMFEGLEFVVKD